MIREAIQKKSTQTVLIILVAGIWIYNSLKIISIQSDGEIIRQVELSEFGESEDLTLPDLIHFEYRGNFRDPFTPLLEKVRTVQASQVIIEEQPEPEFDPELMLTGIFEKFAVLQDKNGSIFFAEPGDSVGKMLMNSVYRDSVVLRAGNRSFSLQLHQ